MVIRAYIDESYKEPRTFALGCVLARGMDWFEIARQWKKVLDRKNRELATGRRKLVTRFHATYCNSMREDFEGWDCQERDRFLADLIAVVNRNRIHIIGHTVDLLDVAECFPTRRPDPKRVAYLVLSIMLWKEIAAQARRIHCDPEIEVVYEDGPFNGLAHDSYSALSGSNFPDRVLFRRLAFDSSSVAPLQVADLVAYETMKEHDRQATGRERRPYLKALLEGTPGKGLHVRGEALRRIAKGYWAKVLAEMLERRAEE